jgi:hypothetical protein
MRCVAQQRSLDFNVADQGGSADQKQTNSGQHR